MLSHWPQRLSWMPETFRFAPQCLFLHIHTDSPACTEAKQGFLEHLRDKPGRFTPMYRHNPVFSSSSFFRLQLGGHRHSLVYLWQIRPDHPGLPSPHQAPDTDHKPGRHFHLSGTRMRFFKRQTKMLPPLHQTTGQKKGKGHVEYEKGWWWKKGDNPISYGMYVRPFFTVCAVCGYHPPRVCWDYRTKAAV